MTREEKEVLVDRLILRFAMMVLDLPASKAYHHARPFGLLAHSLGVVAGIVRRLSTSVLQISCEPHIQDREGTPWKYGAFVMALVHDLGKAVDIDVQLPGQEAWNPYVEPLSAYAGRQGRSQTGWPFWRHPRVRGHSVHEWHGIPLLGFLLHPEVPTYLGDRLSLLQDAVISEKTRLPLMHLPPHTLKIAGWVGEADQSNTLMDYLERAHRLPVAPSPEGGSPPKDESLSAKPAPRADSELKSLLVSSMEKALSEGALILNGPGGLFLGSTGIFIEYPETVKVIFDLLGGDAGKGMRRVRSNLEEFLLELEEAGCLPLSAETGRRVEPVRLIDADRARELHMVALDRSLLGAELPLFRGTLQVAPSGGEGSLKEGPRGTDPAPGEQAGTPARPPSLEESLRIPFSYARRAEFAALDRIFLLEELEEGLQSGAIPANSLFGQASLRPDRFWFRYPETLDKLFRRVGILMTGRLGKVALKTLLSFWGDAEPHLILEKVAFFPESPERDSAFSLPADLFLRGEARPESFFWPHPVEGAR